MFIHCGLYSLPGQPRRWAKLAREAGMRYMVLTAKHHDGFRLWDSQQTEFTSAKTAGRRGLVAEYVAACRAEGLKVGLYCTLKDWTFLAYFRGPDIN